MDDPGTQAGLTCTACGGTGQWRAYRDLRAYRLGLAHGLEVLGRAIPHELETMGLEALQRALDGQERERP